MCKEFSNIHWSTLDYIDGHTENALRVETFMDNLKGQQVVECQSGTKVQRVPSLEKNRHAM